ncbi:hypothetical protein FRX31_026688 [Thalictrum thalictroides]|uniref:Uncharacterized protein n=1 Tax=Thalictrum thalictroides TaxID=46969 RepID=A0A7J6VF31_THATH|nr:hypothetical protein FRX31_026688 [Thalictrum thalictroides]
MTKLRKLKVDGLKELPKLKEDDEDTIFGRIFWVNGLGLFLFGAADSTNISSVLEKSIKKPVEL